MDERTYMKVRLFRLAQKRWNLSFKKCGEIFEKYHIYDIVDDLYDRFHIQGDDINLDEIEEIIGHERLHYDTQ